MWGCAENDSGWNQKLLRSPLQPKIKFPARQAVSDWLVIKSLTIGVFWPVNQGSHCFSIRSVSWVLYYVCLERKKLNCWKIIFLLLSCCCIICLFRLFSQRFSLLCFPFNCFPFDQRLASHFSSVIYSGFKVVICPRLWAPNPALSLNIFSVCVSGVWSFPVVLVYIIFHWKRYPSTQCFISAQNLFRQKVQGFSDYSGWRMASPGTIFLKLGHSPF